MFVLCSFKAERIVKIEKTATVKSLKRRCKLGSDDTSIVSNPQVKQLCSFNQVYSMILSHPIIGVFMWIYNRWEQSGGKQREREREREREKESSRLMEWEIEDWTEMEVAWVRNGCLWKWTPECWVFLAMKINRTNKLSIKLDGFQICGKCRRNVVVMQMSLNVPRLFFYKS